MRVSLKINILIIIDFDIIVKNINQDNVFTTYVTLSSS